NAQFLQIGLSHIGQDFEIDGILVKDGRVLGEPDPIKPGFYLVIVAHCRVRPTKSIVTLLCPRGATGQAAAAPPSSVMNSRRLIRSPRRRGRTASAECRGRHAPIIPACCSP